MKRIVLVAILFVAIGLRVRGLSYGLPAVYNPDEVAIMSRALAFAKGDLNPHNFLYPTFYFYVLFGWIGAYFAGAYVVGAVQSVKQFQDSFFIDPSAIYLAGRTLTLVCGVATVAATYLLGRRLFNETVGLAAALLLAVSPIHVMDSHYVKHDVPVTLLVVLAHLAILGALDADDRSRTRRVTIAGAACGAAIATHYYAVFVLVPLMCAIWFSRRSAKDLVAALAAAAVAFFVLSPFVVLNPATTWQDVVANRQIVMDRATQQTGLFGNLGRYAALLFTEGLTLPVAIVGFAGLLTIRNRRAAIILLAFPIAFLLFISNTVPATRYLNPVLPSFAIGAAMGIDRLSRYRKPELRPTITALLTILLLVPAAARSVRIGSFFQQPDTRTLARQYIDAHIQSGATILIQPYSVALTPSREGLREALQAHYGDVSRASTKFALQLQLEPYPSPSYRVLYLGDNGLDMDKLYVGYGELSGADGLDALRRRGVEYLVLKRYNVPDPATQPLIGLLEARPREAQRLATYSPYRTDVAPDAAARVEPFLHNTDAQVDQALERPGPTIEVWRLTFD